MMSEQGLHLVCRSLLCRPIQTENDNNNNNNNIVRTFKQKKDSVAHALLYSTVQYSTVQNNTVQYSTAQHSTVQYSTVPYSTVQQMTVQYSKAWSPGGYYHRDLEGKSSEQWLSAWTVWCAGIP